MAYTRPSSSLKLYVAGDDLAAKDPSPVESQRTIAVTGLSKMRAATGGAAVNADSASEDHGSTNKIAPTGTYQVDNGSARGVASRTESESARRFAAARKLAVENAEGYFEPSLRSRESVDFLLTPALLMQEAISDDVVISYPAE